jgi:uncharacterized protein
MDIAERLRFLIVLLLELSVLYLVVTILVGLIRQSLTPRRLWALLGTKHSLVGMAGAAGLGIVTPFCSCSTVPLVAGMLQVGVALPVVITFLIISPLVNPAAFALLATLVSPSYAALYVLASLAIGLAVGGLSFFVKPALATDALPLSDDAALESWAKRWRLALGDAWRDYGKFLPVFVLAAVVGAMLHNNVAPLWLAETLSGSGLWLVPLAAIVGVPVYASTALLLPLGTGLYLSGVNLGVVTAFLMGATGFSIPEGIMLARLLGTRLLLMLALAFTLAVIAIGYLFQALG